ncbi:hypothetical protein [Thermocatellispora tengchongensis]
MTWWTVVRFLHVLAAALWVGGQLTVSLVVLPWPAACWTSDGGARC